VSCPGYLEILRDTMFDRTTRLKIIGPFTEQDWQAAQAVTYSSAYTGFRIVDNRLDFYPQIGIDHMIAFEYKSDALVFDSDTTQYKNYFTKDTDTFALNPVLILSGLRYLWKKEKGLPYVEEFKTYERNIAVLASNESRPGGVNMSGGCSTYPPGILIPDSDWIISP